MQHALTVLELPLLTNESSSSSLPSSQPHNPFQNILIQINNKKSALKDILNLVMKENGVEFHKDSIRGFFHRKSRFLAFNEAEAFSELASKQDSNIIKQLGEAINSRESKWALLLVLIITLSTLSVGGEAQILPQQTNSDGKSEPTNLSIGIMLVTLFGGVGIAFALLVHISKKIQKSRANLEKLKQESKAVCELQTTFEILLINTIINQNKHFIDEKIDTIIEEVRRKKAEKNIIILKGSDVEVRMIASLNALIHADSVKPFLINFEPHQQRVNTLCRNDSLLSQSEIENMVFDLSGVSIDFNSLFNSADLITSIQRITNEEISVGNDQAPRITGIRLGS